jgi:hypothetical protein
VDVRHRLIVLASAAALALALLAAPAAASDSKPQVSRAAAIRAANLDPKVKDQRAMHPHLKPYASFKDGSWLVDYYAGDTDVVQVTVDQTTGLVRESWTGYQIAWKMARGYPGAFGHKLNAPYVWLPLCAIFLLGLLDWRRPWRIAHLDLLVLLSFGVSQIFFNDAQIGVSVPLAYPPLIYLTARMLWIGFRGRGEGLRPVWPARWLLIAALFLMGFRIGLNVEDSGVVDIGYSGVIGADRIAHGEPIYGNFPSDDQSGDTYGPVNYYAYVPFERIYPWTGTWNDLPSAHAASVFFDLTAFGLLILLGYRLRPGPAGRRLAAILAFGWAAFPYTGFALESNSNDALLALFLIAVLLALSKPVARGALTALAAFTKFAPLLLVPMLATYTAPPAGGAWVGDPRRPQAKAEDGGGGPRDRTRGRAILKFVGAFALVAAAVCAWALINPGPSTFWNRTIGFQAGRESPFSIWGQVSSLEPLRDAILIATCALAVLLAFRPRRKSPLQVAAFGAALLLGLELTIHHWFYLYIVWFYPYALLALAMLSPGPEPGPARSTPQARPAVSEPQPPSPRRSPLPSRSG